MDSNIIIRFLDCYTDIIYTEEGNKREEHEEEEQEETHSIVVFPDQ